MSKFGIYHSERGWFIHTAASPDAAESWTQDAAQATQLNRQKEAEDVVKALCGGPGFKGKVVAKEIPAS